jgi:endonuclease-3 related protein
VSRSSAPPTIPAAIRRALREAYRLARARFGHQHWWPAETPFEVCVGAILTQNTAWSNVERALANLKSAGVLDPHRLYAMPLAQLARHLRPAGYFNVKARRLRAFLEVLVKEYGGDLERMLSGPTQQVRARLLNIPGVGPETADSMLLYAGGHAVFVVDAYTRRIFARHGWYHGSPLWSGMDFRSSGKAGSRNLGAPLALPTPSEPGLSYDALQQLCTAALNHKHGAARLDYWQDYHAQLVMLGKHYCRTRNPLCHLCPLRALLPPPQPATPHSK